MDLSRGLLKPQSALQGSDPKCVNLYVKGLGFLIRFGFKRKHGSWRFGALKNHPFVKVKAHPILGYANRAKDLIFGLKIGAGSQASGDVFRWFCVESGNACYPTVVLIDGFPSQAYSYRKVDTKLSNNFRAIAFDWVGFGFSDKPQPRYGFDYTLDEYVSALKSLIDEMTVDKVSIVVQDYFSPVVVKYAYNHQEKLKDLVLPNPPLTATHANLPSSLSIFSNFLLGEIFSQKMMQVYRRPYLTSGSAGFALNVISRAMKKDLKEDILDTYEYCKCKFQDLLLILSEDNMLGRQENLGEHEAMHKMKNEFMVNWDGLRTKDKERVLVLAATNRPFDLDEAVIRRLPRSAIATLLTCTNGNLCVTIKKYWERLEVFPIREILGKEKKFSHCQEMVLPKESNKFYSSNCNSLDSSDVDSFGDGATKQSKDLANKLNGKFANVMTSIPAFVPAGSFHIDFTEQK
ncbi:hypothetical protein K2173_017291 [Erythroxylum novogranatense]|uniref:Uncharacterized protein n=1 Tax=Erythroxylum novogranatense TaxID=1862640 RepID=A0AAV8UB40_9ROSI|nr:hypothetical protein K2173_017291 [Erythroxylum novogranatense]